MKELRVAVAGLGSRGMQVYMKRMSGLTEPRVRFTAAADMDPERVKQAHRDYHVPREHCFAGADEMLARERMADCVLICTQDADHVRHALLALEKGYDILLEKPVSPRVEECLALGEAAKRTGRRILVAHVLRYTPFYRKVKEIVDSGVLGRIIHVRASENVGYWHQSHSFVRGNWRNTAESSPMILAKCCHDMDLLSWLIGTKCLKISSMGSLSYFKKENAPQGSTPYCLSGCKAKETCVFDAEKLYITGKDMGLEQNPKDIWLRCLTNEPTRENVYEALRSGPYGRCVFQCNNDVVDHQTVNMQFENDVTVDFSMCAFSSRITRDLKIMGTKGELSGEFESGELYLNLFGEEEQEINAAEAQAGTGGHCGGDAGLVRDFVDVMCGTPMEALPAVTPIGCSLQSHFMALAAEESRLAGGAVIDLEAWLKEKSSIQTAQGGKKL